MKSICSGASARAPRQLCTQPQPSSASPRSVAPVEPRPRCLRYLRPTYRPHSTLLSPRLPPRPLAITAFAHGGLTTGPWVAAPASQRQQHNQLTAAATAPRRRRNRAAAGVARGRSARLVCRAFSLPDNIDATVRNILSISAVVGISYAVLLAAVSAPPEPPPPAGDRKALGAGGAAARGAAGGAASKGAAGGAAAPGAGGAGEDNFVWGLMGFISVLPLFNWLAWVLAAISDEDRAALYGLYAALYGSPLLLRGLEWRDPWALLMLALCVAHVQAERIAATEPETLRSIRPVGALGAALRGAMGGAGALLSGLGSVLVEDARRAKRRPAGRGDGGGGGGGERPQLGSGEDRLRLGEDPDLVGPGQNQIQKEKQGMVDPRRDPSRDPELEDYSKRELRQFDEMLRQKQAEKERQRRGGGPGAKRGGGGGGSSG